MSDRDENKPEQLRELPGLIAKEIGTDLLHNAIALVAVVICIAVPVALGYLIAGDIGLLVGMLTGLVAAAAFGIPIALKSRDWLRDRWRSRSD